MLIFKKLKDPKNPYSNTDITFEVNELALPEILEEFKNFLAACGYPVGFYDVITIEKEE